jgi:hypothetical protein
MLSDIENVRKLTALLGDEGFVDALTNAEELVNDVDERLERVEEIEGDAEQAVREANDALNAVDYRLQKFDEAIRLIEAKIEAGFSAGFFFFAFQQWQAGAVFLAAGLAVMGLLGISSLAVTVVTMPQVQRLLQVSQYLADRFDGDESTGDDIEIRTRERRDTTDESGETGPRIEWRTTDSRTEREADDSPDEQDTDDARGDRRGSGSRRDRRGSDSRRDRRTGDSRRDRRTDDGRDDRTDTDSKHDRTTSEDGENSGRRRRT